MRNDRIQSKNYPTNFIYGIYMLSKPRPRICHLMLGMQKYLLDWNNGCLERKTEMKKTKYNVTSVARISNQSVPNHVSEDMIFITIPSAIYHIEEIFIAGLPDNIVVV